MKTRGVQGGGVYINAGTVHFDGCNIHDNEAHVSARRFAPDPLRAAALVFYSLAAPPAPLLFLDLSVSALRCVPPRLSWSRHACPKSHEVITPGPPTSEANRASCCSMPCLDYVFFSGASPRTPVLAGLSCMWESIFRG